MKGYYSEKLSAEKLRKVYACAPPRVRQYLRAEIDFVLEHISEGDAVLDLGCGYGRALEPVARKAGFVCGIDTSLDSLLLAAEKFKDTGHIRLVRTDAAALGLADRSFDLVFCIQNGISAFSANPFDLVSESIRVTKKGGTVLFSSYSPRFWPDRLDWFLIQSELGLVGELDPDKTAEGVIICKDGFSTGTFTQVKFIQLMSHFNEPYRILEIDRSSLFCIINPV
ncbi:MAG: class I SAM-dependent methyltransferase [candidate division Zixibacteria bacterium]|nr:class I SAM-dependent methyltransferase [candidate division Zixibacteria bacterium]